MEEVEVNRNQEKNKLYISDTPFYLDASSIITAECTFWESWFQVVNQVEDSSWCSTLEKFKNDSEQELRIMKLEKDLFEQKLKYVELQRKMIAQ